MKKILIRSGIVPLYNLPYEEMILEDKFGSNLGNLIYTYSICKSLMVDNQIEFIPTKYRYNYSDEEIAKINDECEYFVIPLADAVRPDFVKEMRGLTNIVKKLKIPCYVIGMGVRAEYEPKNEFGFEFDKDVREFIGAILEKSTMVGLRGNITADYIKRLGFAPEKDFTVIGCPSMYTFGDNLPIVKKVDISEESKVCYNMNFLAPIQLNQYIQDSATLFRQAIFIPQNKSELEIMYAGGIAKSIPEFVPKKITDAVYAEGNCRFFGHMKSWIDFMKTVDFSFGSRLHGNIIAVLAGTPSILIPFDARERELAEYHELPRIPYNEINEDNILKLIDRVDFQSPQKVQADNFSHYVDFLKSNGLKNIYTNDYVGEKNTTVWDKKIEKIRIAEPLESITQVDSAEIANRLEMYHKYLNNRNEKIQMRLRNEKKEFQLQIEKLKEEIQKKEETISKQRKELSFASVKMVMKLRKCIEKTGVIRKIKRLLKK